jgi:hypothetical protein
MTAVSRARYQGWVSWAAYNIGLFTIGSSLISSADVFGVSPLDASFGGAYDDVSSRLRDIHVTRGRNNNFDAMLAGGATVDLRDPYGDFNPENAGVLKNYLLNPSATTDTAPALRPARGPPPPRQADRHLQRRHRTAASTAGSAGSTGNRKAAAASPSSNASTSSTGSTAQTPSSPRPARRRPGPRSGRSSTRSAPPTPGCATSTPATRSPTSSPTAPRAASS